MAADGKRKLKMIRLLRILETSTDSKQGLTMPQILERLEAEGSPAERKSVYRDLNVLREAGYQIMTLPTRPVEYALSRNELGYDDVMMLIDVVQSCRFLSEGKSRQLVKSLKALVSERERALLERRVHVSDRITSQSESVFHNVDIIHEALKRRRKIQFLYFSYGTDLSRRARHGGKRYTLTPVKVIYSENNYYLAAYDDDDDMVKTYRIDRMELLQLHENVATRCEKIANYEFDDFAYRSFGMFHGESACVILSVKAELMDAIVDRFGRKVDVVKATDELADIRVNVLVSPQFFGWVAGLNGGVTIRSPKRVASEYKKWLMSLIGE